MISSLPVPELAVVHWAALVNATPMTAGVEVVMQLLESYLGSRKKH